MKTDTKKNVPEVAVLIPCFNEEKTITKVINDFRHELPEAEIIVFDNNSTDATSELAVANGAILMKEKRQGKGFVINSMFKEVVADIYVMVDGDDTYPANRVHDLIAPVASEEFDMVVGQRLTSHTQKAFPPLHYFGNRLVCWLINRTFSTRLKDPMSGYRVFNRSLARQCPIVAKGFDVETEMTLQLLYRNQKISEIEVDYRERPAGSFSKLKTFRDGGKVLYKLLTIVPSYKPLTFFGSLGLILLIIGLIVGSFVIHEYVAYQYIYSVPKAILATGMMIISGLFFTIGIILHFLNFRLLEESSNTQKLFRIVDRIYRDEK